MIRGEQNIETKVSCGLFKHTQSVRREGGLGEDQRCDELGPCNEQVLARILHARVQKCSGRQADHASGFIHIAGAVPAADREHTLIVDCPEKGAPPLKRIKAVFAEAEGAGAGRRPGINHAHLHQIEFFFRTRKPAACIVDMQLEIGNGAQI